MEVKVSGGEEWSLSPVPAAVPAMLYTYLWLSLLGVVHTLSLPPFIGVMSQARNRPVRPMGILQDPHSLLPWALHGQAMPLAHSVLDWGGALNS